MMLSNNSKILLLISLFLSAGLFLNACSDSTSSDDPADPEITGFLIEEQGVEIVRYENGTYTFNENRDDYVVDNSLSLSTTHVGGNLVRTSAEEEEIGDRRYFTPSVTIRFIQDDGDVIDLPEERTDGGTGSEINPEGYFRLKWDWTDPAASRNANLEQHGSDGSWMFHIRADYEGNAGVTFRVDRCDGDRELENVPGENNRIDQVRNCSVEEITIFQASIAMPVFVDQYDLTDETGKYPHMRHERQR